MLRFKVMPDGGEFYIIDATTRDIWKWEKTTKGASFGDLKDNMRMVDLYRIAYWAAVRQGRYGGTLAEFEESSDLDILKGPDQEADDVDPTRPGPPADSS